MFDTARRMLFGYYHGQPITAEGPEQFQRFLMIMARKVLRGTEEENEDAAAEFSLFAFDRAKHPTWLQLSEAELWQRVEQECYWFMRRTRAERFAENHHDVCSAGQIARPRPDETQEKLVYVTTGAIERRLPNTADIDRARNIFLDALDTFNSSEWPSNDHRALAKHVLVFYAERDMSLVGRDQRWSLQRRYGLKQKEIASLFGISEYSASVLLKKAREERHPASDPGEPIDGKLRLTILARLDTIIKNPDRYRS